ncbi:MAG: hypothetical protein AAF203_03905, partial [Pseudomonadota bacterium]
LCSNAWARGDNWEKQKDYHSAKQNRAEARAVEAATRRANDLELLKDSIRNRYGQFDCQGDIRKGDPYWEYPQVERIFKRTLTGKMIGLDFELVDIGECNNFGPFAPQTSCNVTYTIAEKTFSKGKQPSETAANAADASHKIVARVNGIVNFSNNRLFFPDFIPLFDLEDYHGVENEGMSITLYEVNPSEIFNMTTNWVDHAGLIDIEEVTVKVKGKVGDDEFVGNQKVGYRVYDDQYRWTRNLKCQF